MGTCHMKIGSNLPELLLSISQEHILNGDIEKGIETYTESLCGFTKEYTLMILKNKAVLVVDEDEQTVNLDDDETLRMNNQDHIYDWNDILDEQLKYLVNLENVLKYYKETFENVQELRFRDIEDYSLYDMMLDYYTEEQLKNIGVHNLAAKLIKGDDFAWNQYGNGSNVWEHLCENVESDIDVKFYEKALYYTVKYVDTIRIIHKEYIKFDKLYHFLIDNGLAKNILFIEQIIQRICYILKSFSNINKSYHHGMCDEALVDYKKQIIADMQNAVWGKEYFDNNYLLNNIEDGYDAGWLSPDGEFIGANGDSSSMIHMYIAEDIFNGNSAYAIKMKNEGVSTFATLSPEQWLIKEGWLKIHHNEIYGYFKWSKDEEIKTNSDYKLYCPTEKQIKQICKYVDKFYNGKFYIEPKILGTRLNNKILSSHEIKQMDEIALHNAFRHY